MYLQSYADRDIHTVVEEVHGKLDENKVVVDSQGGNIGCRRILMNP